MFYKRVSSTFQEPSDLDDREDGEWCLVNHDGYKYTLPKTMIFLGREECDVEVQVISKLGENRFMSIPMRKATIWVSNQVQHKLVCLVNEAG